VTADRIISVLTTLALTLYIAGHLVQRWDKKKGAAK
jgi:hypothetical protein